MRERKRSAAVRSSAAEPRHQTTVLENGLRVVTVERPGLHSVMLALYVRLGSRHEAPEVSGVSHFLEHLFFRGSRGYPDTVRMNAAVEAVGGNLNGVTTRDHGYYYTPLHPDALAVGVGILGDLVQRPLLRDMDVERRIILEEMLDEVDEKGRDIDVDNLAKQALFPGHGLALKIAGTRESVRALRKSEIIAHHARHYTAANLVLCAAGPVHDAQLVALADRHFGRMSRGAPGRDEPPPPWPAGPALELVPHGDAQSEFRLSFPAVPEAHPDYPVHLCIRRLLDDGLSSRLPFEVIEKRGLAYSLHAGIDTFSDSGAWEIEGACAPDNAAKVIAACLRVLGKLCEDRVPAGELARVQRRHRMGLEFSLDSAADLCGWFGGGELLAVPESFAERCERVERVTVADVRRVARKTFTRENLLAVVVGPAGRRRRRELDRVVSRAEGLPRTDR